MVYSEYDIKLFLKAYFDCLKILYMLCEKKVLRLNMMENLEYAFKELKDSR